MSTWNKFEGNKGREERRPQEGKGSCGLRPSCGSVVKILARVVCLFAPEPNSDSLCAESKTMSPRPGDSPISSPRTRSPAKGMRTGGVSCAGPDALSMLNMLAEVASVTLHTDPSVTDITQTCRVKVSGTVSRRPSDYDLLTLEHVSGMTDNLLLKLFAEFESNEMWKRFTYTCGMLPAACSKYYQSFGSEHKARSGMKAHLQTHLKSLLEVHKSGQSRQSYLLESVPARRRRLAQQDTPGNRRRGSQAHTRANKSPGYPKISSTSKEKENEGVMKREEAATMDGGSVLDSVKQETNQEVIVIETKPKRKLEGREGKVRAKKVKATANPHGPVADVNDNNNNNSPDVKPAVRTLILPQRIKKEVDRPPMQQVVSHDHGYLRASPLKCESGEQTETRWAEHPARENPHHHLARPTIQVVCEAGDRVNGSVSFIEIKEEPGDDRSTLLHDHMNQELQGGMMAQGCGSSGTPLPVVGCEIEFLPDQNYKVMRSADLPIVYDHNDLSGDLEGGAKVIERDEYKVRKKPKGRAKFIGQSKVEKEMALKLITEIRSQSTMALDTLECKICHPPRLFTAPSTLLSHYRSHAGIRPYECRICEAVFTRQHSLNYHMLIHTNQTRFTCSDCGRKFRHPSHFKEHRRRHTGESPYECSDCLMRFKTRNTYKRHLRTRHGKLLTTQGTIVILSQEEADRMKKSQGRKPRRPRQPLKIISPEAAAQMEEEQVWTDFEEGDREEDELDEEEDEERRSRNYGKVYQSRKQQHEAGSYQVSSDNVVMSVGMKHRPNGNTGLLVQSRELLNNSNISQGTHVKQVQEGEMGQGGQYNNKQEIVEEEVVMEGVCGDDMRTFVFHPPPQHNTLPKVNIRSSWNTINFDLKSLEMASELAMPESTSHAGEEIVEAPLNQMNTQPDNTDMHQREVYGDHISPEEIITICSSTDSVSNRVKNSRTLEPSNSNNEWFTVKKPIKCYSRSGQSATARHNPASCAQPDTKPGANGSQGVYVVEYVQSNDGRLAKVYRASASLVPRSDQQGSGQASQVITTHCKGPVIVGSGFEKPVAPVSVPASHAKSLPHALARQGVPGERSHQDPHPGITTPNNRLTVSYDEALVHEQVVSHEGDNVVKCGGVSSSREPQSPTVTLHSSPSVVVTTVPHVSEAQQLPGSQLELYPWSSQALARDTQGSTYSTGTGVEETESLKNNVCHLEERNHLTYPFIHQEVEEFVGVQDDILLGSVEIIESFDVGAGQIIVNTGMMEECVQTVCVAENITQVRDGAETASCRGKVEELMPCETGMLENTTDYVDHLLTHNVMLTSEQNTSTPQDSTPPPVTVAVVHRAASTLQV